MYVISNSHSCYFCGTLRWWSGGIDRNGRVGDGREVGDEFGNHLRLPLGQQPQFLGLLLLDPVTSKLFARLIVERVETFGIGGKVLMR